MNMWNELHKCAYVCERVRACVRAWCVCVCVYVHVFACVRVCIGGNVSVCISGGVMWRMRVWCNVL